MICESCLQQDHLNCDDVKRQANHLAFAQRTFDEQTRRAAKTKVRDKKVTSKEDLEQIIERTKPYNSCTCQHRPRRNTDG